MRPSGTSNAFDLVRLVLAGLVLYSHADLLSGYDHEWVKHLTHGQTIAGSLAVLGFFGLSGFLVTRSFCTRADALTFLRARALRILPGFYFALFFTAFIAAPLLDRLNPQSSGWRWLDALNYCAKNSGLRVNAWHVGDAVRGLPFDQTINGALWSLFPEVCCYLGCLALGLIGAFRRWKIVTLAVTVGLFAAQIVLLHFPAQAHVLPGILRLTGWTPFLLAFSVGQALYVFGEYIRRPGIIATAAGGLLLLPFFLGDWLLWGPLLLPLALICGAQVKTFHLRTDLSYGIYVLHFPVLQIFAAISALRENFAGYFAVSTAATLALAWLSWHVIESPALRWKKPSPSGVRSAQPPEKRA